MLGDGRREIVAGGADREIGRVVDGGDRGTTPLEVPARFLDARGDLGDAGGVGGAAEPVDVAAQAMRVGDGQITEMTAQVAR